MKHFPFWKCGGIYQHTAAVKDVLLQLRDKNAAKAEEKEESEE